MIYLKLVWEIFHIVHKELPRKEEVSKVLETYIQENLQQVLPEFETLAQRYKTKITKYTTIEEFQFWWAYKINKYQYNNPTIKNIITLLEKLWVVLVSHSIAPRAAVIILATAQPSQAPHCPLNAIIGIIGIIGGFIM